MKTRNLVKVIVLTIVTFGIYWLYWIYSTRKELVALENDPKAIPSFGWLIWPVALTPLTLIPFILMLPTSEAQEPPLAAILMPMLIMPVFFLGYIGLYSWWFYRYCKVASKFSKGIEFMPSYILFLLTMFMGFPLIWEVLMQNDFNNAADRLAEAKKTGPKTETPGTETK